MITEGNIKDADRVLRNIMSIINAYNPELTKSDVSIEKTQKNNYKLLDSNGNLILLLSKQLLNDELINTIGIKLK